MAKQRFVTISELRMDDKVIPQSTADAEKGKVFIVTDLHPTLLRENRTGSKPAEYVTAAVSLWEYIEDHYGPGHPHYGKELCSNTSLYLLVSRRWEN
jgi:hypothetical protein